MRQTAALFVVAAENVEEETASVTRQHYFMGQRDAFEAVFRACHDVEEADALAVAYDVLDKVKSDERVALMAETHRVLRLRRTVSRENMLLQVVV